MKVFSALLSIAVAGCWLNTARAVDERPLDDGLLIKASSCENAIIENSKLADKRAASAAVKEFAANMVIEHQKCYDKLAGVVKNRKIAVVSGLEKQEKEDHDRLSKLSGADFDREYMKWVVHHHKDAIGAIENQIKNGKNGEITTFAKEALPQLQDHLKRAEGLAKTIN